MVTTMPTSLISNNSLINRDLDDQMSHCASKSAALANAVGKFCQSGDDPLIIGDGVVSERSDAKYDTDPHPASITITGSCFDSDLADVHNGPPADISDICMSIAWQLCALSVDIGGIVLKRGKNKCQQWAIPGWRADGKGFDYTNMQPVDDRIEDPE